METCTLPPEGWWCSREARHDGPCAAREHKIVTVTIEENGILTFLATDSADIFLECGETLTRRASHVEPTGFWLRVVFHALRTFWGRKTQVAAWTRNWKCMWRVNTSPVGGPILRWHDIDEQCNWQGIATFRNRQAAIDAEIKFLNEWFAVR